MMCMWKFAYFLMIFISERFNFSLIEAGLAEAYCENWQLTVEETLNAQACELELLQKFCQAWQIVSAVGREAFSDSGLLSAFYTKAESFITGSIPTLVQNFRDALNRQLLDNQEFFRAQITEGAFLPNLGQGDGAFWTEACAYVVFSGAQECKDGLVAMSMTLSENETVKNIADTALSNFARHEAQYLCCVCAEALGSLPADASTQLLRSCMLTVQDAMVKIASLVKSGFNGDGDCKAWVMRFILAKVFGDIFAACNQKITDAIASQPDSIDSLMVNRNQSKLRQIVFCKTTHEACVGGLDDFSAIVLALESLPIDNFNWLTQGQCSQVKALGSKLGRIKHYASVVHGLNLVCNRFANKSRKERSAMVREHLGGTHCFLMPKCNAAAKPSAPFQIATLQLQMLFFHALFIKSHFLLSCPRHRKTCERASITVPKALTAWLQEEAAV